MCSTSNKPTVCCSLKTVLLVILISVITNMARHKLVFAHTDAAYYTFKSCYTFKERAARDLTKMLRCGALRGVWEMTGRAENVSPHPHPSFIVPSSSTHSRLVFCTVVFFSNLIHFRVCKSSAVALIDDVF